MESPDDAPVTGYFNISLKKLIILRDPLSGWDFRNPIQWIDNHPHIAKEPDAIFNTGLKDLGIDANDYASKNLGGLYAQDRFWNMDDDVAELGPSGNNIQFLDAAEDAGDTVV